MAWAKYSFGLLSLGGFQVAAEAFPQDLAEIGFRRSLPSLSHPRTDELQSILWNMFRIDMIQ